MRKLLRPLAPALLLGITLLAMTRSWGPLPPTGQLLDPWHGLWGVARAATWPQTGTFNIPELTDSVTVVYDDRAVPHIFAANVPDAQRALGYVVARDRLFQLELQARATAGRLTEWFGTPALDLDRNSRRLALAATAEEEYQAMVQADAPSLSALDAFAEGVNAWIDQLDRGSYPIEYHILGVSPERWRPVYTLFLLKSMSRTLSFTNHDRRYPEVAGLVGPEAARALIPRNSPIQEPIVPNGTGPRFDLPPIPPSVRPDPAAPDNQQEFDPGGSDPEEAVQASNSWAVAPSRSAGGHALLAGDPHLALTLPSTWFEVHQVVPGMLDAYGATLIGTPGIVVGFNRDVAWTFTNNQADVTDYYREVVDNSAQPTATILDGEWHAVEYQVEEYLNQAGDVIGRDTTYRSHRGPMVRDDEGWLSLRWLALEPSRTVDALLGMARAENADQWLGAAESFDVPSQNGLVADRQGTIAIRSLGRVPIRPVGPYQFIWAGAESASDWRGFYQVDQLPTSIDPERGFLASANQQPVDPLVDTTYWGRRWPTPWRALTILDNLRSDSAVSVETMQRWQTDPASARAAFFLPFLFEAGRPTEDLNADDGAAQAAATLAQWDGRYTKDNPQSVLFEAAMTEVARRTWDELDNPRGTRVFYPGDGALAQLMVDPESDWWDDGSTGEHEVRDNILRASLEAAWRTTNQRLGDPSSGRWRWDSVRRFTIPHLLQFRGFGAEEVANQGGPSTLSPMALRGSHGASWRMVVELSTPVRAWTTYPGGQSGNPASRLYRNRIAGWSAGELDPVRLPSTPESLTGNHLLARVTLVGDAR